MRLPLTDIEVRSGRSRGFDDVGTSVAVIEAEPARRMASLPIESGAADLVGSAAGVDAESWYQTNLAGGDDHNPDLMGRLKYLTYREMLTDPACRSLIWLYKLPSRTAQWDLKPAADTPFDRAVADFHGDQFGIGPEHPVSMLDLTWESSISQALNCLPMGAMGEELIWAKDLVEWIDADGDSHLVRPLARLAPRWASTIIELDVDPLTGKIRSATQDLPGSKPIPGSKLAWYVAEGETSSLWGSSMLRPAYGAWKTKRQIMISDSIGYDRWSAGTPVVRYPSGGGPTEERRAQSIGRSVRVHERGWVVFEGAKEAGWDLEILNGSGTIADPISRLRYYDQQIAMSGLQQFSSLGTSDTGSRAVGETLADPYYQAVTAVAKGLAAERMKVIRRVTDVNFGENVKTPILTVSKIQGRNVTVLARALADLATAGFTFTDRDTQDDVRDQLDLRHLPEAAQNAIEALPDDIGIAPPGEGTSIAA